MRQTAARLNRTWLTVIGLLLLLTGLACLLIGTGLLQPISRAAGFTLNRPTPANHLFGSNTAIAFGLTWVVVVVAAVGIILALLALAWLIAQIPRTNEAKPFRLHDDAEDGLTRCAPNVLTDAIEAQIKALPDVHDATAVLRGTVHEPDLTVKVTASDRADLADLVRTLQSNVSDNLSEALDTPLRRLAVQVDVAAARRKPNEITV